MRQQLPTDMIQLYTKIQQSQPVHSSTLLNKQVGYYVHVETDKNYKIKNCVDSQKTNAQLYKRFSKEFVNNVQKGTNQMLLCCGLEENARMETAIGCKKNPGMFLIAGIGILDEKYQEDFTKFDVEISFMEYIDGNFYDLLSYTKMPLKLFKKDDSISYGQSYCKISTFSQFLKLFKIALFNNKQRDLKVDSSISGIKQQQRVKSSLVMTILTKKYSNFAKVGTSTCQKTVVIDFAGSRPSTFQQQNSNVVGVTTQKNIWDYFMIEMNNLTGKKKMHYHLVQPNPLLALIKNCIKKGKTYILPSFSANPQYFLLNYKYLSELTQTVDLISKQNQQKMSIIRSQSSTKSYFHPNSTSNHQDNKQSESQLLQQVLKLMQTMQSNIKSKKYTSLRQYRDIKQKNIDVIDCCIRWIQGYKRIFNKMMENKRDLRIVENQNIADQIKLIGVCVKSQHYKDFYQAKSYITLQRQILIKTQGSRQQISKLSKIRYELKDKFTQIRNKHGQFLQSLSTQNLDLQQARLICSKILDFLTKTFSNIVLYSQRTVIDQILKQESINENLNILSKKLNELGIEICQMSKKGNVLFQANQYKKDAHLTMLIKQVQNIVKKVQKNKKKEQARKSQTVNDQNLKSTNKSNNNSSTISSTKFTKLPALSEKKINFQITGNFELSSLLFDPNQVIRNDNSSFA